MLKACAFTDHLSSLCRTLFLFTLLCGHPSTPLPVAFICCSRKVLAIHRRPTELDFKAVSLLLLAGDVALNPGPTAPTHDLRIGSINVRSVREKGPLLHDLMVSKSFDILAVTETWLRANDTSAFLSDLTPPGFSFLHVPRHGRPRGGFGLFISDALSFLQISLPHQSSIEAICCTVATGPGTSHFTILNLYRPPGSDTVFFDEFQNILSSLTTTCPNLVITGDFNLHIDTSSHCTKVFHDILFSFDLQQLVSFPTHSHGHTLDLLIASSACTFRSVLQTARISDHFTVIGVMSFLVPSPAYHKTISYRNLKSIDLDAFRRDILNSALIICPTDNAVDLANQYNSVLSSVLDKHGPHKSKRASCRPDNPWMSPSNIEAKRRRQYLERTWRHNPTPLNRSRLTKQTNFCNRLMSKAKSNYYTSVVSENSADQRSLSKTFNKILHRHPVRLFPERPSLKQLADKFGCYFSNKISLICSSFPCFAFPNSVDSATAALTLHKFSRFTPVSDSEVERLIMHAPVKSCDLDPIPTRLLKSCIDLLSSLQSINSSICHCHLVPSLPFSSLLMSPHCSRSPVSCKR